MDISIHAPREGGDMGLLAHYVLPLYGISIHAPREGGDLILRYRIALKIDISIHAPREGGDLAWTHGEPQSLVFQSTPPARGATAKMHSFTCGSLTNK